MKKSKRDKLEKAGFKVGSVQEFLNLSDADMALIEMRRSLAQFIRTKRAGIQVSQTELAKKLRSNQARIARMEAAESDVSLDFMCRAAFVLGVTTKELANGL